MTRTRVGRRDPGSGGGPPDSATGGPRRAPILRIAAAAAALALAALVAASVASAVAAASPDPSASAPPDLGAFPNIEVWLDKPVPPDARAGSTIEIGLTIWDSHQAQFLAIRGLILKLYPATGKADPSEAETRSDWPGHLLASVVVPMGGPGTVVLDVRDQTDRPVRTGGTGPPVSAPLSSLVGVHVDGPSGTATAGQPLDLVVDVKPLLEWEPALDLPDRLVVMATSGQGPDVANTEIRRAAGSTATYAGSITVPQAGRVELLFAFPGGTAGPDDIIRAATTRILVQPAVVPPAPTTAAGAPAGDGPPWPLIGGSAALLLAAALVLRRVFADL